MEMSEEPEKIIYSMIGVGKYYDKKPVLRDISLSYFYGAKIGVLGLNGSGKSSLLRIMAGVDREFVGETVLAPGYAVGMLEQEPRLEKGLTVRQLVEEGVQETVDLLRAYERLNERFAEPLSDDEMNDSIAQQAAVQERLEAVHAWDLDSRLEMAMDALRCPPEAQLADTLSGGERRRVALCRLLLQQPDILLLDEPTNHLDAESVAWLERHLQEYPGTVIAVTHDRYFLDNVAGWILELDQGRGIPWRGNYSSWLEQKRERLRREEKTESQRQRTLQRERGHRPGPEDRPGGDRLLWLRRQGAWREGGRGSRRGRSRRGSGRVPGRRSRGASRRAAPCRAPAPRRGRGSS